MVTLQSLRTESAAAEKMNTKTEKDTERDKPILSLWQRKKTAHTSDL